MGIRIGRILDLWLGVPLCFVFTCLDRVRKFLRLGSRPAKDVKKVLFIKLTELGAVLLAYPLIRQVRRRYPSAEVFFLTFEENRDVFRLMEDIVPRTNVLTIRHDGARRLIADAWRAVRRLRKERVEVVFDLEFFARFTALLACWTGAATRVGFDRYEFEGLYRGRLFSHRIPFNPLSHVGRAYLAMDQALDEARKDTPEFARAVEEAQLVFPRHASDAATRQQVAEKLKSRGVGGGGRLFLLNPGEGSLPLREWPLENFIRLARRLMERDDDRLLVIGREAAGRKAGEIVKALAGKKCADLSGQTSLEELMELFHMADALICNDCGLAHLAMLTPVREFVLFGPESPQIFGPMKEGARFITARRPCSPCLSVLNHRNSSCADNVCLKAIDPDEVYEHITRSL